MGRYKTSYRCPCCQGDLYIVDGVNGPFIGCGNYPECRFSSSFKEYYPSTTPEYEKRRIEEFEEICRADDECKREEGLKLRKLNGKLRPCPFCHKHAAKIFKWNSDPEDGPCMPYIGFGVRCENCGIEGPTSIKPGDEGRNEVIRKWNGQ